MENDSVFLQKAEFFSAETMKVVAELGGSYARMSLDVDWALDGAEEQLQRMHEKVLALDSDQSSVWDRDPDEASELLRLVDGLRELTQSLSSSQWPDDGRHGELLSLSYSILQTAMARLEEEFVHLLVQYQQPMEPDRMSFRSTEDDSIDDFSRSSFGDDSIEGKIQSESSRCSEDFLIDLIHPGAVYNLRCIAEAMFLSNYEKECCQAYVSIRKEALDECLSVLQLERLSIDEILQLDWNSLNAKIKRWNRATKVFVRVYLTSESRLSDLVFGDLSKTLKDSCFLETSKASVLQLLNFGEAVAIGPTKTEKVFRILDMYEGLSDLVPDMESLFPEKLDSSIMTELSEVLSRLGESVRAILVEFKTAIQNNTSTTPFAGGGTHPLTKYVMNYLKVLADYNETLNLLLEDKDEKESEMSSLCVASSPLGNLLRSVTSLLESNLNSRSLLYRDTSLQNIFMMNNIYYMVQKVKDSDLRTFLGDDWIKEHNRKFQQHEIIYERASWTPVLSFLKDDGICNPSSSTPSKTVLKERFRNFNLAFEEVYRNQTAWLVPAVPLRDDLRISLSLRVIQAYRTFMGRYAFHLDGVRHRDNFIKYSPDDLENFLQDLFEGSAKSLHWPRRW